MELCEIKGIGAKRTQSLNAMGIYTASDLLLRFPDKYIFANRQFDVSVRDGEETSFCGEVISEAKRQYIRRGLTVVVCGIKSGDKAIKCSWFNQPFAARSLKVADKVSVIGKVKRFKSAVQLVNPTVFLSQTGDEDIIPVYKTSIPSRTFAAAVKTALGSIRVSSYVPAHISEKFGLLPLQKAIESVHAPKTAAELDTARRSVAIEQMCYVMTTYRLLKNDTRDFFYDKPISAVGKFISSLKFKLTCDQETAINDILGVMTSDKLMNMLVQGEVGSGKTVVAIAAMYYAALCGHQSALMAPTEVLARQHYETASRLLEPLGIRVQLLCASMTKPQRDEALFNIRYGAASCIIGTQSLIGENLSFADLRLVVVDEQQRFGVNQRAKLESKGRKTDMIVMTATPIPRTLALSLYGELQQTYIRSLPANRPKIHTSVVPPEKTEKMFKYIEERAALDERTYIICPRISGEDDDITGVETVYDRIKNTPLGRFTACVHGKMKDAEKPAVMADFKCGRVKVLISTTVVEVGIDVPEATNVVIFDAERFGLAQLHQIRGRVGRGTKESYCFLLTNNDSPEVAERLKRFCSLSDGFSVSELDFKMRGAGDFVGLKQHGNGSLEIDETVIEKARALSDAVIEDGSTVDHIMSSLSDPEFIRSVTMN